MSFVLRMNELENLFTNMKDKVNKTGEESISEDYRGYNWRDLIVAPHLQLDLPFNQISYEYCDSGRFPYLHKVKGLEVKDCYANILGRQLHRALFGLTRRTIEYLQTRANIHELEIHSFLQKEISTYLQKISREMEEYDFLKSHEKTNINEYCKSILYFEYGLIVSRIQYEIAKTRGISKTSLISHSLPILVEDKLTVRDMGFSDTMTPDFIFTKYEAVGEFKGFKRNVADQSYRVAVTGYALAYEKSHHTKVDVGCVLFLDLEKTKETPLFELDVFVINDELRRAFLLKRNTSLEIVYKQIEPKLATKCPRSCPFLEFCKPESDNIDESK